MRPWPLILLALMTGCGQSLPRYPWVGTDAAVSTLAGRATSIHSLRATATLVLTSADNQHVTLDAAVVARQIPLSASGGGNRVLEAGGGKPPASAVSLRIRTWKFGQAIFDLTAKPEGIWIASDSKDAPPDRLKRLKPENIAQAWNLFFGDFFSRSGLQAIDRHGPTLTLTRHEGNATIACDIDKETLTARQYRITDDQGRLQQTLTLARYQEFTDPAGGKVPWPMLIIASGAEGQVQLRFDEVEVNPDLEPEVFTPPRRAARQP